jgi:DNA-binding transcriptional MerR regulator
MRSGELARLSDISSDTLRYYERLGILPKPPRTAGGYRDYPPHAVERVRLIRRAMSVGFSLSELTTLLKIRDRGGFPCHETVKLARRKLQELEHQIRDLNEMREQLELILRKWNAQLARTGKGTPARLLENLPDNLTRVEWETKFKRDSRSKQL